MGYGTIRGISGLGSDEYRVECDGGEFIVTRRSFMDLMGAMGRLRWVVDCGGSWLYGEMSESAYWGEMSWGDIYRDVEVIAEGVRDSLDVLGGSDGLMGVLGDGGMLEMEMEYDEGYYDEVDEIAELFDDVDDGDEDAYDAEYMGEMVSDHGDWVSGVIGGMWMELLLMDELDMYREFMCLSLDRCRDVVEDVLEYRFLSLLLVEMLMNEFEGRGGGL